MNMLPFHPASSSLGVMTPGQWSIPNNPISDGYSAEASSRLRYKPRFGELVPAQFSIPENPLLREISGCSSLRGCQVGFAHGGLEGVFDDLSAYVSGVNWTTWALLGGGLVLVMMLSSAGGGEYRSRMSELRSKQAEERRQLKRRYRGYRRAARRLAA